MKAAVIFDEFTFECFRYECQCLQLHPDTFYEETYKFSPDILIIESAWFGLNKLWNKKISTCSSALVDLVKFYRNMGLPTVFWCKEDPMHFDAFLASARLFDFVFTTDVNCIGLYKRLIPNSKIFLLPFACQPSIHNPVNFFTRKIAAAFAGSYYSKYFQRSRDLYRTITVVNDFVEVDIYDRYQNIADINYRFPNELQPLICGTLAINNIDVAYKGYRFGININTVKDSESMFARRAPELLGSGTVTISNYSKAFPFLFGDIIIASDDPKVIQSRLTEVVGSDLLRAKLALAGVRKVMREHTYAHRLARIMDKALGMVDYPVLPSVLALFTINSGPEFAQVVELLSNQTFDNWKAICLVNSDTLKSELDFELDPRIQVILVPNLDESTINDLAKETSWIAMMDPSDYYGPNYLLDLVLATRYSKASAFGKKQFFEVTSDEVFLQGVEGAYRPMTTMDIRSSLISVEHFSEFSIPQLFSDDAISSLEVSDGMSLDFLSYCRNVFNQDVVSVETVSAVVDDLEINQGSSIDELYAKADALKMAVPFWLGKPGWKPEKLAQIFGDRFTRDITGSIDRFGWHIISEMRDGDTCELFSEFAIPIEDLGGKSGTPFYMEAGVGLQMQLLVRFEEASGTFVDEVIFEVNAQNLLIPPDLSTHIRLGYRITSSGSSRITRLVLA